MTADQDASAGSLRPETAYRLPEDLRPELARPWGPVVETEALRDAIGGAPVIAVGDIVSLTVLDLEIPARLLIVDYRTQRHDDDPSYKERLRAAGDRVVHVENPAGTITREAWDAIAAALQDDGTTRIVVDGEEDLLGIPCFLEAEAGTAVLYGVPDQGVAVVHVDARVQGLVADIVARMDG